MKYMNEYDIDNALERGRRNPTSYQYKAALIISYLKEAVDQCSDGWAYWRAPARAAQQMMTIALGAQCDEKQYKKAVSAIKAFYTRNAKYNIPKLHCLED